MDGWQNFYLGQVGAAAALGGLVFVGVSINLAKIMSAPNLPNRAQEALGLLFYILILGSIALVPGLDRTGFGAAALVIGALAWLGVTTLHRRSLGAVDGPFRRPTIAAAVLGQIVTLAIATAGVLMLVGQPAGMYLLVGAILAAYFLIFIHAWVLLVEVNR
jgi:hypothetical protein